MRFSIFNKLQHYIQYILLTFSFQEIYLGDIFKFSLPGGKEDITQGSQDIGKYL